MERVNVIAFDPGIKATGWAEFFNRKLTYVGLVRASTVQEMIFNLRVNPGTQTRYDTVVVERPQVYDRLRSKGDPNDLIGISLVAGAAAILNPTFNLLLPHPNEWKGQVPKDVHHARARAIVEEGERATLTAGLHSIPQGLRHNALDAVALGLWALGRLPRG